MHEAKAPLRKYAQAAISRVRHRATQESSITHLDIGNLKVLADVENQRNHGLQLRQFTHQDHVIAAVKSGVSDSFRAVFPLPIR
ncbi:hypothetical protein [Paraburkholderia youngii]|uniref:YopJ family acetyltransferase n=1 Tax=Paraburkholderia youngii TaxID=2782701 RepID=UPI003D24F5E9